MTNTKNQKCEYDDAFVMLCSKKISSLASIQNLLEEVNRAGKPLLIIAEDIESEALATLIVNRMRGVLKITAAKAPGFGDNRKAMLQDMAVLTGGELISDDLGLKMENVGIAQLGLVKKIEQDKDTTTITAGDDVDMEAIAERCEQLRASIEGTKSEYEKEKMQERLAKLSAGVAVIKVGGSSEVEVGEAKDRVVDALNATQAAVDEGIVAGGGTALLFASRNLKDLAETAENFDIKHGIEIVARACRVPVTTIVNNAGGSGAVVVENLLAQESSTWGFDAATGEYKDMVDAGIIDPRKVTRTALQDAAGVASLMCTTEAMVVSVPDPAGDAAAAAAGGGGAMGGMGMGGMGGMM